MMNIEKYIEEEILSLMRDDLEFEKKKAKQNNIAPEIIDKMSVRAEEKMAAFKEEWTNITATEVFKEFKVEQENYDNKFKEGLNNLKNDIRSKVISGKELTVISNSLKNILENASSDLFDYRMNNGIFFRACDLIRAQPLVKIFYSESANNIDFNNIKNYDDLRNVKLKFAETLKTYASDKIESEIISMVKKLNIRGATKEHLLNTFSNINIKRYEHDILKVLDLFPSYKLMNGKDLEFFKTKNQYFDELEDKNQYLFVNILKVLNSMKKDGVNPLDGNVENILKFKDDNIFEAFIDKLITAKINPKYFICLLSKANPNYDVKKDRIASKIISYLEHIDDYPQESFYEELKKFKTTLNSLKLGMSHEEKKTENSIMFALEKVWEIKKKEQIIASFSREDDDTLIKKYHLQPVESKTIKVNYSIIKDFRKNIDERELLRLVNPITNLKLVGSDLYITFFFKDIKLLSDKECMGVFLKSMFEQVDMYRITNENFHESLNNFVREKILQKKFEQQDDTVVKPSLSKKKV